MTPHSLRSLLVLALAATAAACGGGADAGPGPVATPNVTMKGVITARSAGQITVNGVALTATGLYGVAVIPALLLVGMSLASVTRALCGRVTQAGPAVWFVCVVTAMVVGFYAYSWLTLK